MFVKRNKSRPSLRARDVEDEPASAGSPLAKSSFGPDELEQDEPESSGSVMERKKARAKEKRPLSKGSRLSFGGDGGDEAEEFKPKKSLLSQSLKLPSTPTSDASPPSSSIYSREHLSELKASTPSKAPQNARVDDDDDDEDQDEDGSGLSRIAREKYASVLVEDTTAGIPDEAAVAAAKSKRQAAVESGKHDLGEDYKALGGGQIAVYDGEKGPHPESRLMREEDEGEEGDEELAEYTEVNDKLFLGKKANKSAARRMRGEMGEMIDEREAESDSDEDTKEWEEAQARRAGRWEDEKPSTTTKQAYVPSVIPTTRPIPSISPAQARLAASLSELGLVHSGSEHNLEVTSKELTNLEDQEQELRKEVERLEGKREWMEEFRQWIETLGVFLEEKFPKLEDIESDALHHLSERRDLVDNRRANDDSDDLSLFLGSAPLPATSEEVDDLGRSRAADAGPSSAVRRSRRAARETRRERHGSRRPGASLAGDEDGYSTDSSLGEGDAADYAGAQRNLEKRVLALLEDVKAEDFRDPRKGLAVRFGQWRRREPEEYQNAFGGLGLVQAWEFWVRGEMVGWEPLRDNTPLESFSWYTSLHDYSHPKPASNGHSTANGTADHPMDVSDEDEEYPLAPEGDLAAEMVSKTVVPILVKSFENGGYDPYSTKQTRRAIDLVEVIRELTGTDSRKVTSLLKAILGVFHSHIQTLSALVSSSRSPDAIPPPAFDPASRLATNRFVRRRIKLLRNILLWRRETPEEVRQLVNNVVEGVVCVVLGKTWDGGGREMAQEAFKLVGNDLRPDLLALLRDGPIQRRW